MNYKLSLLALLLPIAASAQTVAPLIQTASVREKNEKATVAEQKKNDAFTAAKQYRSLLDTLAAKREAALQAKSQLKQKLEERSAALKGLASAELIKQILDQTTKAIQNDSVSFIEMQVAESKVADAKAAADKAAVDSAAAAAAVPKTEIVKFFGLASLSGGTDFLSDITSTGRLMAKVNLSNSFAVDLGANLLFANPGKVKKDSIDLSSLNFPETGNFALLFSPSYSFRIFKGKDDTRRHWLIPEFDFAYRKVSIDSPSIGFKVVNYTLGLKYLFQFNGESDTLAFSLMPYLNLLNIPREDVTNFKSFVSDSLFLPNSKKADIKSWGIKLILQYKSFLFFADMRHNMHTTGFSDSNPLKGTLFNVGFATLFTIKSITK